MLYIVEVIVNILLRVLVLLLLHVQCRLQEVVSPAGYIST
jgi:hypothetical protein